MFTGLIETTGRIEAITSTATGMRARIAAPFAGALHAGDSVAVNGVCLTALEPAASTFEADISPATLSVTTLGRLHAGHVVNLERSLRADARLGGHFVLGHVDGVGRVSALRAEGDYHWLEIEPPPALEPYAISKGSIAVEGISLTIARLEPRLLGIQIVPFTFAHTNLATVRTGDGVNLEVDVLGKYVARLLGLRRDSGDAVPVIP